MATTPPIARATATKIAGAKPRPVAQLRTGWGLGLVALLAALLYFPNLGAARAPIWDEAYYLTATARYHEGRLQFASHPPLGLMLIAAGDSLSGLNREIDWRPIAAVKSIKAEAMPAGFDYRGPRLASALFGAFAACAFFLLMAELCGSASMGLLLAPLFLCDTALVAQFRAAHLDAFQLFFVLVGLICLIRSLRREAKAAWLAGFGAAIMAAAMVRANALVLAPLGLVALWPLIRQRAWRQVSTATLAGLVAACAVVVITFGVALIAGPAMPDMASPAGQSDLRFISAEVARHGYGGNIWRFFADTLAFMRSDLAGMARADANASHPWQWLAGSGAITFRWDASGDIVAATALVPNRAAWLLSLSGVALAVCNLVGSRRGDNSPDLVALALLGGWAISMASLIALDAQRVMYAYHYFIPLLIGHALLANAIAARRPVDRWNADRWNADRWNADRIALPALLAVTACCLTALPLATGTPVTKSYCRILLRDCG